MSRPKRTWQEAPPQVARNLEYQPSSRRTMISPPRFQCNPASRAQNPEEHWFREEFSFTCGNSWGNPEFPATTREEPRVSAATQEEADSLAATREETRLSRLNSKTALTPLLPLERYPQIPITTWGEPWVSCRKSKGDRVPLNSR